MARILDVQWPGEQPTGAPPSSDYQHIQSSPNSFGGLTAEATRSAGAGLEKAGVAGLSAAVELQTLQNTIHASDVHSWYADQVTDRYTQFSQLQGRAALDALPQYKADIEGLRKQALERAPSLQEQARLVPALRNTESAYYRYGTTHANGQFRTYAATVARNNVESYGNQANVAFLNNDMDGFERGLNNQANETRNYYEQQGYEPATIEVEVKKQNGAILKNVITQGLEINPAEAERLFANYRDRMDPASQAVVATRLKSYAQRRDAQEIGDAAIGATPRGRLPLAVSNEIGVAAAAAGVDAGTLGALVTIESGGNPRAERGSYRGLGQLSDADFQRLGGGDIFNPADNLRATARRLAETSRQFETQYGRAPTAADLYLIHQQGAGGYAAHVANPEAPAWQNMAGTAEGRDKGAAWAKSAIWGNIPERERARFGSVENVSSADFMEIWQRRIGGLTGAAMPEREGAVQRAKAMAGDNPIVQDMAVSYVNRQYQQADATRRLEAQTVGDLVASDVASTLSTGRGNENLTSERVSGALGPAAAARWEASRDEARAIHSATADISALPATQIGQRLVDLQPPPGDPEYSRKQRVYEATRQVAEATIKLRQEDPARSIANDPEVRAAAAATGPDARQNLIAARMVAQTRAGIPPNEQSPVTTAEAGTYAALLTRASSDPIRRNEIVTATVDQIVKDWGPMAPMVFGTVMQKFRIDRETSDILFGVVNRRQLGAPVTPADFDHIREHNQIEAMRVANEWATVPGAEVMSSYRAPTVTLPEGWVPGYKTGEKPIEVEDVTALRRKAMTAEQFDGRYGLGAAKAILQMRGLPAEARQPTAGGGGGH